MGMTGWGYGPGDFREIPEFLRRLADEMGLGGPPPRGGPGHGPGGPRGGPRGGGPRGFRGEGGWGPWGPPPWARGPHHHRGGGRASRGDVRSAVLALLSEEPMHGYQMITEIGRRSGGRWRPSPGSVYPTLQQLEDEGLVRAEERDGRRVYRLTAEGNRHVVDRAGEFADLWDGMSPQPDESRSDMGDLVFGVAAAFLHVMRTGTSAQVEQARRVLAHTRTELYRILGADDDVDPDAGDTDDTEDAADAVDADDAVDTDDAADTDNTDDTDDTDGTTGGPNGDDLR